MSFLRLSVLDILWNYTINYNFLSLQNNVSFKEVKLTKKYLNDDDVFLIDLGLKIYQV